MKDKDKTKEQLINELVGLRQRIAELEASEARRERADEALWESESRFRSVAQTASDAIILFDSHENIVFWNQAAKNIFGYSAGEALGKLLTSIMPERFYQVFRREMKRMISGGSELIGKPVEATGIRKDGSEFPLELSLATWKTRGEVFFTAIARDITERKRAEEALRDTNELLEKIFSTTHLLIAYMDTEFNFIRVNRAYAESDGREPEFFVGKNHFDLYPNEENEAIFRRVAETGEMYTAYAKPFEYAEHPERGVTHWDWDLHPVKDECGKVEGLILCLVNITERIEAEEELRRHRDHLEDLVASRTAELQREITERKRAEEEMRQRTAQLDALRQVGMEITAQLDLDSLLHSIVSWAVELLGETKGSLYLYRPDRDVLEWAVAIGPDMASTGLLLRRDEGLSGKVWETGEPLIVDDYQHWEGRTALYENYSFTAVVGVPIRWGEEFLGVLDVLADSPRTFSLADAELLSLFATQAAIAIRNARLYEEAQLEIEERKRAEEALRESEERFRALVNSMDDRVFILDRDTRVTGIYGRWMDKYGFTPDAYIGRTLGEIFGRDKAPVHEAAFARAIRDRTATYEWSMEAPDGSFTIWLQSIFSPLRDAEGNIVGTVGVGRDITERKRAEEALRQYTVELEARNEELDAFAHTVAHDLKGPLAPLLGYADALEEDCASLSDQELRDYSHAIVQHGRKMSSIIDELLLLARVRKVEEITIEPLDMASIVTEAQERVAYLIEEHQAEIISPDTWPVALGYGPWVEEVWVNYLSNAIKYGGRPPSVELGATKQADGMVRFWVRDNGPGLTLEAQGRLFTSFTQISQVRTEGHGLGLSIVQRIVEKLGGQVGVESEVGRGSVFTFTLPGRTR